MADGIVDAEYEAWGLGCPAPVIEVLPVNDCNAGSEWEADGHTVTERDDDDNGLALLPSDMLGSCVCVSQVVELADAREDGDAVTLVKALVETLAEFCKLQVLDAWAEGDLELALVAVAGNEKNADAGPLTVSVNVGTDARGLRDGSLLELLLAELTSVADAVVLRHNDTELESDEDARALALPLRSPGVEEPASEDDTVPEAQRVGEVDPERHREADGENDARLDRVSVTVTVELTLTVAVRDGDGETLGQGDAEPVRENRDAVGHTDADGERDGLLLKLTIDGETDKLIVAHAEAARVVVIVPLLLSVAVAAADGGLDSLGDRLAKLAVARCVPLIEKSGDLVPKLVTDRVPVLAGEPLLERLGDTEALTHGVTVPVRLPEVD